MLARATVTVDLAKVSSNARRVCEAVGDIEVVGVTKVTCGAPEVARAMLEGGCRAIADSRLENLARLRDAGIDAPLWLLRAPTPGLAEDCVRLADVSLESEAETLSALDAAAAAAGARHAVVLMVDLGDLREGVVPGRLPALVAHAVTLEHLDIWGLGTSLTCYGAVVPSEENIGELVALTRGAESEIAAMGGARPADAGPRRLGVSGGMSSSLELVAAGQILAGVTNLRIGESILLGVSTVTREPILGLHTDAITVAAPVIECAVKPSMPRGEIAQDAFGGKPTFADRGERRRAICALGRQDAPPEGLSPLDPRVEVLGASSDHLILDVHGMPEAPRVGDAITFVPNYSATLRLFTSPYVGKVWR